MNPVNKKNLERIEKHIAIEAIKKKLLGKKLNYDEIFNLMNEISQQDINDILTTYFVAASFKEGFSDDELYYLTKAMVETGKKISFEGIVADKHSTGGVAGTRTTMIIVPIVASCGFKIPKLSSRAITSPAGTADVMEVLAPVTFSVEKVKKIVEQNGGCVVWNGSMGIAPADDIIIKIEEPLSFESYDKVIVSIMAKKIAVGATHLVLDIPIGPTMKIKHKTDAEMVAVKFTKIARRFNIEVVIDINEMYEPAGNGIGPALEARDVLTVLEQKENRPMELEKKALRLAGKLLDLCFQKTGVKAKGEDEAKRVLSDGTALKKFKQIIEAQGGNSAITSKTLYIRSHKHTLKAPQKGIVESLNNYNINAIAKILGAPKDHFSGIYLLKKTHDPVAKNEPVAFLYAENNTNLKEAIETIENLPIHSYEKN